MCRRKLFLVLAGVILGTCVLLYGCGSDTPSESKRTRDGRVLLRNDTPFDIRAIYTHTEHGEVETLVPKQSLTPVDVSQYVLEGGTTVKFTFIEVRSGHGNVLDHYVDIPIDGNVTVLATFAGGWAPVEFVVS